MKWRMKRMNFQKFKDTWKEFSGTNQGFLKLAIDHPLEFQVGYSSVANKALIVMNTGIIDKIPCSKAISAENRLMMNGTYSLELQLLLKEYEEEFLCLGWDIIMYSKDADNPVNALIERYLSWQKLLQYVEKSVMPLFRQKGLIGELLHLQEIIPEKGINNSIISWVGPDGADQDFIFEDSWDEIKEVSLASDTVKISSFEQLLQEKPGTLSVYVLERTTPGKDRIQLTGLVSDLRDKLSQSERLLDAFNLKLFKYGYRDSDTEEYDHYSFRFIERKDYIVDDNFPKLTKNNVPTEITSGEYNISLSAIEKYKR